MDVSNHGVMKGMKGVHLTGVGGDGGSEEGELEEAGQLHLG